MKYPIILLVSFLLFGCTKSLDETIEEITLSEETGVLGCWIHDIASQTEDLENSYLMERCYQLDNSTSPSFRYSFILNEDGKGSELLLGIADNHDYSNIRWSIKNDLLLIGSAEYRIVERTNEKLLITRI